MAASLPLVVLLVWPAALQDGAGFGGSATDVDGAHADAAGGPSEDCVVRGDDGVWRTCADVLAPKSGGSQDFTPPRDTSPEAQALRERMKAVDAAQAPEKAAAPPKTKLEIDLEKAHLDPTMPLLALRVDVERKKDALALLEKQGRGGPDRERAEQELADAQLVLDAIERIALHRMDVCAQRTGKKSFVKNYRMTAGGPVLLNVREMMAQLPIVDPGGCERILIIDAATVDRVRRTFELRRILKTRSFGYREVGERKKLEAELKGLETELAKDAIPALSAPGVKDPY